MNYSIRILQILGFLFLSISDIAYADYTWMGNIKIITKFNETERQNDFYGQTLDLNLAGKGKMKIKFDFYKRGITDTGHSSEVWKKVDAKAVLVRRFSQTNEPIKSEYIEIVDQKNNNLTYEINVREIAPNTVGEIPDELKDRKTFNTRINIVIDEKVLMTIPIDFTYHL